MGCTPSRERRGAVSINIELDDIDTKDADLHEPTDKEQALMAEVIREVRRISRASLRTDDSISFEEFMRYVSEYTHLRTSESELRKLFDFLDLDGNGSLSLAELQEHFAGVEGPSYSSVAVGRIFAKLDADSDGEISLAEFRGGYARYRAMRLALGSGFATGGLQM